MNIEIYINNRPAESYTQEEMKEIKQKLTRTAMKAAGYVPASQKAGERDKENLKGGQA